MRSIQGRAVIGSIYGEKVFYVSTQTTAQPFFSNYQYL